MNKKDTGGMAFPSGDAEIKHTQEYGYSVIRESRAVHEGMTLRDYFAARAMTACYAEYCAHANVQGYEEGWKVGVALDSYEMADAMLKAREVK